NINMKLLRIAAWIGLLSVIVWFIVQDSRLKTAAPGFHIMTLELGKNGKDKEMLSAYADVEVGHRTVLCEAVLNTKVDFLFIVCYVACFFMVTYHEMQRQTRNFFNAVLRMNLFFCFVTGALDITENSMLLFDFRHYHSDHAFVSTYWVSLAKWILVVWLLVSIIVSRIVRAILRKSC
ncbi:MAG: hypothetical protein JWQ30_1940, partial [Sediminibacterium sp.]|nr:hypothetical protein [Sediminibacterium sp.]